MTARQETMLLMHALERRGITLGFDDANTLRRAEKTLQRWSELECGDGNQYGSWAIERDENGEGPPYMVHHYHKPLHWRVWCVGIGGNLVRADKELFHTREEAEEHAKTFPKTWKAVAKPKDTERTRIADREAGALRRIAEVCKRIGAHFYHQTDPRGCALYIAAEPIDSNNYTRGFACCS